MNNNSGKCILHLKGHLGENTAVIVYFVVLVLLIAVCFSAQSLVTHTQFVSDFETQNIRIISFFCSCHRPDDPTVEKIANITMSALI